MNDLVAVHETPRSLVLNNPDILDLVFEYFEGQMTLRDSLDPFPAILTCKSFLNPALNALWKSLDSLLPLLKLLPPSFMNIDGNSHSVVNGPDRARFESYAKRVRYIDIDDPDTDIPQDVYSRLAQLLGTSPLFPNLLEFRCHSVDSLGCGIFIFLTPSLQLVHLLHFLAHQDDVLEEFLSTLASGVPHLKHLTLHGELSKSSWDLIGRFKDLQSLVIEDVELSSDSSLLQNIWTIQPLRILDINLNSSNHHPGLDNDAIWTPGLRELRDFSTRDGSLPLITHLMDSIHSSFMETITIIDVSSGTRGTEDVDKFRHSLGHLLANWDRWKNSLCNITISFNPIIRNGDFDIFMPLSIHRNLTRLDLSDCGLLRSYSSSDVCKLVKHWPLMESLHLPWGEPDCEPTIHVLAGLAECCPRLRVLQIPLNAELSPLEIGPLLVHGLQSLQILNSRIKNASVVARYLDRLFPKLRSVSSVDIDGHEESWQRVEELVLMLQRTRG